MVRTPMLSWNLEIWGVGSLMVQGRCGRLQVVYRRVPIGTRKALSLHWLRQFCCVMYGLATMHGVTDTDNIMMPTADHTACSAMS